MLLVSYILQSAKNVADRIYIGQFTVNEWAHETAYKMMSPETKKNMGPVSNGMLTLACGVTAVCLDCTRVCVST